MRVGHATGVDSAVLPADSAVLPGVWHKRRRTCEGKTDGQVHKPKSQGFESRATLLQVKLPLVLARLVLHEHMTMMAAEKDNEHRHVLN